MRSNRYVVALAGVIFHLMIGSVYAWSVYAKPIASQTSWSESAISFAFSLAIFFLGMSAAFMGRLVERFGPTVTGTISALLFGTGIILTGVSIHLNQLWMLYLSYGVIGGLGLGSGYVTPVSTIIKWFPDKRGLATGLAIMGFGFAALLTSPIAQRLMSVVGLETTFYILGAFYMIVMLIAAQFIKRPKEGDVPEVAVAKGNKVSLGAQLTANQALKTKAFYSLWFMLFINITCGIGLVSAASPMAQEMTAMNAGAAAVMVGIIGLFNGFGRLIWATLSDYIGRPLTFSLIFIVDIIMLATLLIFHVPMVFVVALACSSALVGCSHQPSGPAGTLEGNIRTYSELADGTWQAEGNTYRYRLEIGGRMPHAAQDVTFVYLSNVEEITFEQAWRAAGLSSDGEDSFAAEEALLVEVKG